MTLRDMSTGLARTNPTAWYNNWYHNKFGYYPKEVKAKMTTQGAVQEAPAEAEATPTPEEPQVSQLEKDQVALAEAETAIKVAGLAGDTDKVLELAGIVSKLRNSVLKSQRDANKDKIDEMEVALAAGIGVIVSNTDYKSLTGENINNVVWYMETPEGGTESVMRVRVNAASRAPRAPSAGGSGNGRKVISGQTVTRTLANGTVESMTVKEVVQAYADEETKNSSLYEPKKAWGILFPKVNRTLDPRFSEPV